MTLAELADEIAENCSRQIGRHFTTHTRNQRLRAMIAARIIGGSDSALSDFIHAYVKADDRNGECLIECSFGDAYAAEMALEDLRAKADAAVDGLAEELPSAAQDMLRKSA